MKKNPTPPAAPTEPIRGGDPTGKIKNDQMAKMLQANSRVLNELDHRPGSNLNEDEDDLEEDDPPTPATRSPRQAADDVGIAARRRASVTAERSIGMQGGAGTTSVFTPRTGSNTTGTRETNPMGIDNMENDLQASKCGACGFQGKPAADGKCPNCGGAMSGKKADISVGGAAASIPAEGKAQVFGTVIFIEGDKAVIKTANKLANGKHETIAFQLSQLIPIRLPEQEAPYQAGSGSRRGKGTDAGSPSFDDDADDELARQGPATDILGHGDARSSAKAAKPEEFHPLTQRVLDGESVTDVVKELLEQY